MVVRRAHLGFYRRQVAVGPLHCVVLAPGAAEAGERNLARDKTLTTNWSFLDTVMRAELADECIWIDNARLTVQETVDAVLAATGLTPPRSRRRDSEALSPVNRRRGGVVRPPFHGGDIYPRCWLPRCWTRPARLLPGGATHRCQPADSPACGLSTPAEMRTKMRMPRATR